MYEDRIKWIEHKGKNIVLKEEKHSVLYCVDVSKVKFSVSY